MTGPARHRAQVEDLVESEPFGPGVGALANVDDAADGVQEASRYEQAHDRRSAGEPELGQEPDCHPAQSHVQHRGEPARGAPPDQAFDDPQQRPAPHDAQHERGGPAAEQRHRQRCVGAGDQEEDVGVVEGLEGGGYAARQMPVGDVIHAGVGEEQQGAGQVGGACPGLPGGGSQDGQHDAGGQRQGCSARVNPAAQVRLGVSVVGEGGLLGRRTGTRGACRACGALHGALLGGAVRAGVFGYGLMRRSLNAHVRTSSMGRAPTGQ